MVKAMRSDHMGENKKQEMPIKGAKTTLNNEIQHMEHETRASGAAGSTEAASRGGKHSSHATG
jgi:hypothetical protein